MPWLYIAIIVALAIGVVAWWKRRKLVNPSAGSEPAEPGVRPPGVPLVGDVGGRAKPLARGGDAILDGDVSRPPSVSWLVGGGDPGVAIGGPKDGVYPR